jgi:hypothetical protein
LPTLSGWIIEVLISAKSYISSLLRPIFIIDSRELQL